MQKNELKSLLTFGNYFLGVLIFIFSLGFFIKNKALAPLFISAAIIIVGPVENILMKKVSPQDQWIVDQLTSIGMLIFLLLAELQCQKR